MTGNSAQVGTMSTGRGDLPHMLTTGSRSGEIINFDVRMPNPIVSKVKYWKFFLQSKIRFWLNFFEKSNELM